MPKLKKHSQRKSKKVPKEQQITDDNQQDVQEDCSLKANLDKPKKMKLRQRVKMLQNEDEVQRKTQRRYVQLQEESNKSKNNNQDEVFLNKYTDDDIDTIDEKSHPPQKQKRVKKNQIRTRNKMFSTFEIQESKETSTLFTPQESQEFQLQVIKKQKRQSGCLLQKVDQKVNLFKKKFQYKDLNKDHKYKNDIKNKLKSIQEAQEINISVEVPKVFGGKHAHLEAAIYLKNKKEVLAQQKVKTIRQSQGQEESIVIKDRRQYYQDLGKQMKLKKAETITENILKECFKKSQLQDLDFQPDLGFDGDSRERFHSKNELSNIEKIQTKQNIKKSDSLSESNFSNKLQIQIQNKKPQKKIIEHANQKPQIVHQKQQNKLESHQQQHFQDTKEQEIPIFVQIDKKVVKDKRKKQKAQKRPKLKKNFEFSKYVQLQADISDDQQEGGPKHKDDCDEQSNDQQQTQISSLIDDDVDFDSRDRGIIHRKYLKDMLQRQEKLYNQMKQKMQKRYLQQQEDLRRRMQQAARRNKIKEQKQDSVCIQHLSQENQQSNSKSNDEETNLKNQAKLKELEQRLHINKKQTKQPLPQTEITKIGKLKQIETAVLTNNIGPIKKAIRNGLHNMVANKGKSKPKK